MCPSFARRPPPKTNDKHQRSLLSRTEAARVSLPCPPSVEAHGTTEATAKAGVSGPDELWERKLDDRPRIGVMGLQHDGRLTG